MKKITIHDDLYAFLNDLDARVKALEGGDAAAVKEKAPPMAEAFTLAEPMKDVEPVKVADPIPGLDIEPAKVEEAPKGE